MSIDVLDQYIASAPSDQNALDIFKGEWASQFPRSGAKLQAGDVPLFEDERVIWAIDQLGGVQGQRLLELGPLEAAHTYMLEQAGAELIVAIEANTRAYLRCLIVKEIMQLQRSKFLCGDFIEHLRLNSEKFDAGFASGVLYHMKNPAELIYRLTQAVDHIFIWTHYFDLDVISADPMLSGKFALEGAPADYRGFQHRIYRQEYLAALDILGFCGGSSAYSHWMSQKEILACLEFFGFGNFKVNFDNPHHQNGPSFAVVADRVKS